MQFSQLVDWIEFRKVFQMYLAVVDVAVIVVVFIFN